MKILQVNVNAMSGSTGKIVTDMHNTLIEKGHESLVCYGANETVERQGYYRVCSESERKFNAILSRLTGINHGLFGFISTPRLLSIIRREKPDVVHLQCPNGYMVDVFRLLKFLGKNGIKTVVTNHAEYFYTGSCGHALDCNRWLTGCGHCDKYRTVMKSWHDNSAFSWQRMKVGFDAFDVSNIIVTSVSPWLMSRSKQSPFMSRFCHTVVMNGLDDGVFCPRNVSEKIRQKMNGCRKIVLYASASFDTRGEGFKGGRYVLELAKRMPEVQFCIVAFYSTVTEELPSNVVFWGRANGQDELAQLYNHADVTILTSKKETFSMITAESLCCGTPVVGFRAGGPETIAIDEYSRFVGYDDIPALEHELKTMLARKVDRAEMSCQARAKFNKRVMAENYIRIYNALINK